MEGTNRSGDGERGGGRACYVTPDLSLRGTIVNRIKYCK